MSDSKLDQIVKGAPPPNVSPDQVAASVKTTTINSSITTPTAPPPTTTHHNDPRDTLPSSPPQIYLNLLILESSLRLQYLSLRARLKLHLLLLAALLCWTLTFTYLLFFRPREDGIGVGGSVYWVLETIEKLGFCGGVVTTCLFWATGMYERGVRWPRKFVSTTNRGLRGFNMKIVVVKGPFLSELLGWFGMLDPAGWFAEDRVNFHVLPRDIETAASSASGLSTKDAHWNHHAARHGLVEEDIAPGGDVLKLLLLPKPFSPDFREGWETYRIDYWEKDNARRAQLRKLVALRVRDVAKREGGWLWWTGWRGWRNVRFVQSRTKRQLDLEKLALREKPVSTSSSAAGSAREKRRRPEGLLPMSGTVSVAESTHSRSSSRSSTPTPEHESRISRKAAGGEGESVRRGSSASSRKTRKAVAASASGVTGSRLSVTEAMVQDALAEGLSPLSKREGTDGSEGGDRDVKKEEEEGEDGEGRKRSGIKLEPDET